jgi:hypothetical protein
VARTEAPSREGEREKAGSAGAENKHHNLRSEKSKLSCSPRDAKKKNLKQIKKFFSSSSSMLIVVVCCRSRSRAVKRENKNLSSLVEVAKVMLRTWETWIFDF